MRNKDERKFAGSEENRGKKRNKGHLKKKGEDRKRLS